MRAIYMFRFVTARTSSYYFILFWSLSVKRQASSYVIQTSISRAREFSHVKHC